MLEPAATPIYQRLLRVQGPPEEAAHLFELKQYGQHLLPRISNPTTAVFEERMASLEDGTGAVAVASGMAAQFGTFMTCCLPGTRVVASNQLYGGSMTQLAHTLKKLCIDVKFVTPATLPRGRVHHRQDETALCRDHRQSVGQHSRPRSACRPR